MSSCPGSSQCPHCRVKQHILGYFSNKGFSIRLGPNFDIFSNQSSVHHPLSPVIKLGFHHRRKKERKKTKKERIWWVFTTWILGFHHLNQERKKEKFLEPRKKERKVSWVLSDSSDAHHPLGPVIRQPLARKKEMKKKCHYQCQWQRASWMRWGPSWWWLLLLL